MMMMTKSISFSGRPHPHTLTHTQKNRQKHTHTPVLIGCWRREKGAIKVISRRIDRFFLFDCTFWWPSKKKLENNGRCGDVIHQLSFCSEANEAPIGLTLNTSVRFVEDLNHLKLIQIQIYLLKSFLFNLNHLKSI